MRLVVTEIEGRYRVSRAFRVPFHSGGMLHGIFGRALRKVASAEDWRRLFDPPPVEPPPHRLLAGAAEPPGPVVVIAPRPGGRDLAPGQEWRVGLRLFGEDRLSDVALLERSLEAAAALPIGPDEGGVTLDAVTRFVPREIAIREEAAQGTAGRVVVRFETPVRLKRGGKPMSPDDVDFGVLFDQVWRRLTMLCALYGEYDAGDDETFRRLRARAAEVATVERRLRAMRWEHHSAEAGVQKPLQGLLGHVVFEGDALRVFGPVLRAAELVHVGGATGLGLGRIGARPTSSMEAP